MKILKPFLPLAVLLLPRAAAANPVLCPVCTFTIVGALGIAEFLGVSNNFIGVWSGAMLLAFSSWTADWLGRKGYAKWWVKFLCYAGWYSTLLGLYVGKKPAIPFMRWAILGMDAFLFCVVLGTLAGVAGSVLYQVLKKKNGGRAHFPYEKVVVPVVLIALVSIPFL